MIPFPIQSLERHLPLLDNIVTDRLLAIIPWNFTQEHRDWFERLGILINIMVESPPEMAQTLPEFDGVGGIWGEEVMQFAKNQSRMLLEWMRTAVKIFPRSMDGVSYDNDFGDGFVGAGLINATPNGKELYLCTGYKCGMMYSFCDRLISNMDMWYRCSNVVFNASIWYDKSCMG